MRQLIRQPTEVLPSLQVVTNKSLVFIMDLQRGPGRAAVAIREPPQQLEMHIGHDRPYAFMKVTAPPVRVEAADRLQARDLAVFFRSDHRPRLTDDGGMAEAEHARV